MNTKKSRIIFNRTDINLEIFWSKVNGLAGEGCWEWQAHRNYSGYGSFGLRDARIVRAHRVSYYLFYGDHPESVMHQCDNTCCVNPYHLKGGTHAENMRDMVIKKRSSQAKGTFRKGEKHHFARLNAKLVVEIRARVAGGATYAALARELNVNPSTVSRACKGRFWRDVT